MYQCDICSEAFSSSTVLEEHKKYEHEGVERPKPPEKAKEFCEKCGTSVFDIKQHLRRVHDEHEITDKDLMKKCEKCEETFNEVDQFEEHLKSCLEQRGALAKSNVILTPASIENSQKISKECQSKKIL